MRHLAIAALVGAAAAVGLVATGAAAPEGTPPAKPAAPPPAKPAAKAAGHGGLVDDLDCSACHTPEGWKLSSAAGVSGFDHDRTGFPLRGAHVQRPCGDCHAGQPKPVTVCAGCHPDPHDGRVQGACQECHTATAWSDTGALARHRRTRMPLTGRHAQIDCVACHTRQGERTWSAAPVACWSCHAADYLSPATHPTHVADPADPGRQAFSRDCSRCHRTSGWSPAVFDPTILGRSLSGGVGARAGSPDHDVWFLLSSGPHRTADCASCHVDGRRMTRVRCDGCHRDAELRASHRRMPVRGTAGCLRCHPRGRAR
jgi:hypothetical protein